MHLLYLSQYYPPETGAGATRAETIRRYLGSKGWKIDLVCEFPNYPSGVIPPEYDNLFFHVTDDDYGSVIRTWVVPTRRENFFQQLLMFLSFMLSSLSYCLMNPKKYDAIYVTSPPIFGAVSAFILSKLYGVPYFFEVRDLWPDAAIETGHITRKNILFKVSKYLEKILYRNAKTVIPVTKRSESIIKESCPEINTKVIYNGVDLRHFKPPVNAGSNTNNTSRESKFTVGYIGTIGVIHDLRTVVKAAKLLENQSDIEFVIIGDGSQSFHLREAINEMHPKNLKWLGTKAHHEVPVLMSKLNLGLNPVYNTRVFESIITVKFFEYLACSIPVINMAGGILKDVGETSRAAVTIKPEDPDILAETILNLKANPTLMAEMARNGRPFVEKYFDREKWVGELGILLEESLSHGIASQNIVSEANQDTANSDSTMRLPDLPW